MHLGNHYRLLKKKKEKRKKKKSQERQILHHEHGQGCQTGYIDETLSFTTLSNKKVGRAQ
jgi:hypothetical protein